MNPRNTAADYADRLYDRLPAHYRAYDAEQGGPLRVLFELVGAQVADLRDDLDDLRDNFFIETCDEWVVPYLAALVGTRLLARPVAQSNRLDVLNTVAWRRGKGTPAMLGRLAAAISGWPADVAEFFRTLGWSQHVNHVRPAAALTADLRDPYRLTRLGHADDPFSHAVDLRATGPLDQPRVAAAQGVGQAAWGTPGRHQVKNLGFFVRRLRVFRLAGVTPAAAAPGAKPDPNPAFFTFDPIHEDVPLFEEAARAPITRAAFRADPGKTYGKDIAVRRYGILLAAGAAPPPAPGASGRPYRPAPPGAFALDPSAGLRLMGRPGPGLADGSFAVTALWRSADGAVTPLGRSSPAAGFQPGGTATGDGQLVVAVELDPAVSGGLFPADTAHFPGAVVAVRVAPAAVPGATEGLYVYLPPGAVGVGRPREYFVADDGSTYTAADLRPASLARASDGPVYPPRRLTSSGKPVNKFTPLHDRIGLTLPDRERYGRPAISVTVVAGLLTPVDPTRQRSVAARPFAVRRLGTIATANRVRADGTAIPAFRYAPDEPTGGDGGAGLFCLRVCAAPGQYVPASEVVVTSRRGRALLVYLPEVAAAAKGGDAFLVADDGTTYRAPDTAEGVRSVNDRQSFAGLEQAPGRWRPSAGQVLPIPGTWPLEHRRPVGADLCRGERRELVGRGELGIDPELGRFAFHEDDPISTDWDGLTVDYVEAFGGDVGARTFDRRLDPDVVPTRYVEANADPDRATRTTPPVYAYLTDALAAATGKDEVIEILDSATYASDVEVKVGKPGLERLTIRAAAGQRPCLTFYRAAGLPTAASLRVVSRLDALELSGLLVSGGPVTIDGVPPEGKHPRAGCESGVRQLTILGCTLDPRGRAGRRSLVARGEAGDGGAAYHVCRSIVGGLRAGSAVGRLTVADSIVHPWRGTAVAAAHAVHMERVTVLGRVACDAFTASECLLDDLVRAVDRQSGCVRFSRFEAGPEPPQLPQRYQCVPTDDQIRAPRVTPRVLAPVFNSRRFGRPDYAQLAAGCPHEVLIAGEEGSEIGAFAQSLDGVRLANLDAKLREFMPAGLMGLILCET
jgi:hypothetical protein